MTTPSPLFAFFDNPTTRSLESNQRGRLTPEQQAALKAGVRQQWGRVALWIFVLVVLCSVFGLFFWALLGNGLGPGLVGPVLTTAGVIAIAFFVLGVFLFPDLSLVTAGGDIDSGQVEMVPGKVEWTGRKYQLRSDSRSLRVVRGHISMPPPGEYRFYCLPNSGLVVLAEALGEQSGSQSQELLLQALSRTNGFSNDDLSSNRQGGLSGRQILRLIAYAIGQGIVFLLCVGFGVWFYLNQPTGEDVLWFYAFELFVAIFALVSIWNILKTGLDLLTQSVAKVEGYVVRREHRSRNSRSYSYNIKNIQFKVSRTAFLALVEGWDYRVYYSTRSKRLLAIEPLRQNVIRVPDVMER